MTQATGRRPVSDHTARLERVDASLAKQLRASMERNACMAALPGHLSSMPRWTWIVARKNSAGRFVYQVGAKGPLSKLRTYSLADAREAAASFGAVKEHGPPEAFGRKPKSDPLPAATVDEFWRLVELGTGEQLEAWLADRPKNVPALIKLWEYSKIAEQLARSVGQ
jgi:hypothetical protein